MEHITFYSNLDEKVLAGFLSEIGVEVHVNYLDF